MKCPQCGYECSDNQNELQIGEKGKREIMMNTISMNGVQPRTRRIAFMATGTAALGIALAGTCLALMPAQAHAAALSEGTIFSSGGITYQVGELQARGRAGEAKLLQFNAYRTFPSIGTVYYRGYRLKIVQVGDDAFNTYRGHKIRSVTLGKDVRRIGSRAFKGCGKLKTINMRKSGALTLHRDGLVWSVDSCNIGYGAFSNVNAKVKVQCGSTYSAFKSAYKTALVTRGLPTTAKIVY